MAKIDHSRKPEIDDEFVDDRPRPASLKTIAATVVLFLLFGMVLFGAFRGCGPADPQELAKLEAERKKEEERKKLELEKLEDPKIGYPAILPNESPLVEQFVKPGHWAVAAQQMQARERDFIGRTLTEITDDKSNPIFVNSTPFLLKSSRPAALPKGTTKFVDSTFFVPQTESKFRLLTTFEEGGLGVSVPRIAQPQRMLPHQYHFLVLAKEPERYALLKTLDSVRVPYAGEPGSDDGMIVTGPRTIHYYIDMPDISRAVPVPDNALLWTSVAYVLWDEVDPDPFTPEQEDALVDWLFWGGQIIINGPDSLDLLQGSFLEPYLPAANGGPREIAASDLRTFHENWMITTKDNIGAPIELAQPWSGIKLVPKAEADQALFESTGGLLAERRVGRGRIVVSAMQLTERELVNWRTGFESFFNAALLRRPPREYHQTGFDGVTLLWDPSVDPSLAARRLDARLTTKVRYFARDLGVETNYRWEEVFDESGMMGGMPGGWYRAQGLNAQPERELRPPPFAGGIGAWNDFNATAISARNALREAAGVDVPNRTFVVACLAVYLILLVPVNWMIFQMLGRVEWAWIAAPIIAILGTFAVVHQAQLDIGFVRSQTEIGLLELQPDHPRALMTRFTALYTSLSTTYDLEFADPTALAMPFPADASDRSRGGPGSATVEFERQGERVRLAGLPVLSNSTNFVHSEQMLPLDGAIRLGKAVANGAWQLENRSQLNLRSVGVIRKQKGVLRGVWIGELGPGQSTPLSNPNSLPTLAGGDDVPFASDRQAEAERLAVGSGRLNLEPLFRLAYTPDHFDEGELRLVARVDDPLPGYTVTPNASQLRTATLVVAHLQPGDLPPLRKDKNTKLDMRLRPENDEFIDFNAP